MLNRLPHDKQLHLLGGGMLYGPLTALDSPVMAISAIGVIAFGKEALDAALRLRSVRHGAIPTNTPDPVDAGVTVIGGVIAFVCHFALQQVVQVLP